MYGLTKYEKETIILTNEADDFYEVYTFNTALKKKLAAYAKKHPDLCRMTETTKEGSVTYVVDKARLSLRLTEPYSEARKQAAREQARDNGLGGRVAG
ncbi:MAG: molecular chaperone [Oscillospiraceae bacterium]|nr:molecular chaperone [Oscillospiraceae bacterium]